MSLLCGCFRVKKADDDNNRENQEERPLAMSQEDDINIWDEPEEGNIIISEYKQTSPPTKSLLGATLNQLLKVLIIPEKEHALELFSTFFIIYPSITNDHKLFKKILQLYQVPKQPGMSEDDYHQRRMPIQLRVIGLLQRWIYTSKDTFDEKLVENMTLFLQGAAHLHPTMAPVLLKLLTEKKDKADILKLIGSPKPILPTNIDAPDLNIMDVDELELARQITLIDFDCFSSIKSVELLKLAWVKPKYHHLCPNVLKTIAQFNERSKWATARILAQDKIKDRVQMLVKMIKICEQLMKLKNFNATFAILAGLSAAAVHRLKYTHEEMPQKAKDALDFLHSTFSHERGYKNYRQLLMETFPPCIPYLGLFLTDLVFAEEGNTSLFIGTNIIHMSKMKLSADVISRLQRFQQTAYILQPVPQIARLLDFNAGDMDESQIYHRSMKLESRNAVRSEIQ